MEDRRSFGSIPDLYDERDHSLFTSEHVEEAHQVSRQRVNSSKAPVILSPLPPVYSQGSIGSCTANAIAGALRFAYQKGTKTGYDKFEPSRQFIYFNARVRGDPRTKSAQEVKAEEEDKLRTTQWRIEHDTGSNARTTILNLNMLGVCKEEVWPYGDWKVSYDGVEDVFIVTNEDGTPIKDGNGHPIWSTPIKPQNWGEAFAQARDYIPRAISYYRIVDPSSKLRDSEGQEDRPLAWDVLGAPSIPLLEKCIADGYPFSFGCQLYFVAGLNDSTWTDHKNRVHKQDIDEKGVFIKPPTDSKQLKDYDGRHAMLAVGFDSTNELFLVQNSWGTDWPQSIKDKSDRTGRFWMPYEWFKNKHTYDFWVIKFADGPLRAKPLVYNPAHWNYENLK